MATDKKMHYEAMFLFGQAATSDLAQTVDHIKEVLARGDAEIVAMKKWEERRFAYEIKKHKRGLYILVYFECDPASVPVIERAANLSESILRFMIIKADHLTLEEMKAADGQQELADEAAMRHESAGDEQAESEQKEPAAAAAAPAGDGDEDNA